MAETTVDPKRLVNEYVEIWNTKDFSRLSDVVDESFTFTSPTSGTIAGRENVRAYAEEVEDAFSDFRITVNEMVAGENVVIAESTLAGTHEGEFDGIPPTNETFEIRDMARFVVEDDKIQEERVVFDRHDFFDQLGLLED
ncbi:ester cyclase [Halopiger djelfimassiliensis]|uniref:ester cyclase n=1 Tax=Halopiger djelfimassiliensis TaxID=1293047 RepID=UPI0006776B08|nr:ester cyclase [Halopiger djelfimassiliensis]